MKIAFLGLGNMGVPMSMCILSAKYELTVWNRTASKMQPLIAQGAKGATTARDAVLDADVVISGLMDDQAILNLAQGQDGFLQNMKSGAIHLCISTISPRCAETLERAHEASATGYVSGPVVGRPDTAAAGKLTTYLAGKPAAVEVVLPVCRTYAAQVTVLADRPGAANCMKLAINYNIFSTVEAIGEIYVFAEKCGLPVEHLRDFLVQQWFAHPAAKLYAEKLCARDFGGRGGFVMTGGLKDVRLAMSAAADAGARLEIGPIVERKLAKGVEEGMGEADWSAFYEIARRETGLS
jgi:3-hydroxyisobutyrate dehydrogenase-like beta-hydroxyacid dehydrogenase